MIALKIIIAKYLLQIVFKQPYTFVVYFLNKIRLSLPYINNYILSICIIANKLKIEVHI